MCGYTNKKGKQMRNHCFVLRFFPTSVCFRLYPAALSVSPIIAPLTYTLSLDRFLVSGPCKILTDTGQPSYTGSQVDHSYCFQICVTRPLKVLTQSESFCYRGMIPPGNSPEMQYAQEMPKAFNFHHFNDWSGLFQFICCNTSMAK